MAVRTLDHVNIRTADVPGTVAFFRSGSSLDLLAAIPVNRIPTDVTDASAVNALAKRAYDAFGSVDLLFNNAGIMATGFSWSIEPERWARSFDVNVKGVIHGIQAFVPHMLAAGRRAHIVNTASVGGFLPSPLMAPYTATKAAVVAMTESLHGELRMMDAPIGVSLLAPGPVQSGIFDDLFGANVPPAVQGSSICCAICSPRMA